VVKLDLKHLEIVGGGYLRFAKYTHDLYGIASNPKAKEARLRTIGSMRITKKSAAHTWTRRIASRFPLGEHKSALTHRNLQYKNQRRSHCIHDTKVHNIQSCSSSIDHKINRGKISTRTR